ncbi:hypothetical protein LUZ60_012256 [Juncus effusus]|nr:hypothetical protein LUZ60_012256 [Juncus effusus]
MLLLVTAGYRKRNYGLNMKAVSMSIFLWLEYLLADSVAIFALGYLSQNEGQVSHLVILWAPFLLLHLGGQDTITALSIEDNELWKRHLLTFISQACIAIYVFAKSGRPSSISWAGSFIFLAGIVKYVERIWALQKASMSSLRSSCTMEEKKLVNYVNYMDDKYPVKTRNTDTEKSDDVENLANGIKEDYAGVVCTAYEFSQMFKPIFLDLILDDVIWQRSRRYFLRLEAEKAYKVIEVELYFMYDILHTKAAVVHKWYGWFFRISTLFCNITSLVIFTNSNRIAYHKIEVGITYLLLVGAVVLETSALVFMLLSFWTYAAMEKDNKWTNYKCTNWLKNMLLFLTVKLRPEEKSRWSNSIGQCSLLNYSFKCKSNCIGNVMSFFGVKENWDKFWYTDYKPVERKLKNRVFSELSSKLTSTWVDVRYEGFNEGFNDYMQKISGTLQFEGGYDGLGWTVEKEFHRSMLIWHLATDLLLHYKMDKRKGEENKENAPSYRDISEDISKYMLFLLIACPFMLPTGIGQIRFNDTCEEVKTYLQQRQPIPKNLEEVSNEILNNSGIYRLYRNRNRTLGGRGSSGVNPKLMSIFAEGVELAKQMQKLFPIEESPTNLDRMWKFISAVWVDMLCFAASKCGGNSHTKQLSMGGEFLTHVSFLMAHLGMGVEYGVSEQWVESRVSGNELGLFATG